MKADLRREMRARRAGLDPVAAATASASAQARLCALPVFARARRVACYLAAPGEVATDKILRACFDNGKTVAVPARRGAPADYALCLLNRDSALRAGALGIAEPAAPEWVEAADMDLIVVPGVAFDAAGRRLGQGLGCYDRMLAGAGRAFKAGLAFEWQVVPEVPADAHDVAMDAVITERTIYGNGKRAGTTTGRDPDGKMKTTTMGKGCIS